MTTLIPVTHKKDAAKRELADKKRDFLKALSTSPVSEILEAKQTLIDSNDLEAVAIIDGHLKGRIIHPQTHKQPTVH